MLENHSSPNILVIPPEIYDHCIKTIDIFIFCIDIDRIVSQIVKPKVSLYMAIDGVAPRAKLNQQRSRRFRSAQDLIESTKNSKKNSLLGNNNSFGKSQEELDSRDTRNVFDSNCITPGTEFMARVSNAIKYYIRKKIKDDPIWRNLKVIFSGHEVPGRFQLYTIFAPFAPMIYKKWMYKKCCH